MANPYHHAISSAKKWGGTPECYLAVHQWFDQSKMMMADMRHRALRHHAEGIFMCETIFGPTLTTATGRLVPTRWVGEQHVMEDCGFIPSMQDWLKHIQIQPWMMKVGIKHPHAEKTDTTDANRIRPTDLVAVPESQPTTGE